MIVLGLFEHLKCYVWYIEFYSRYDWIDKKLLPHVTYLTGQINLYVLHLDIYKELISLNVLIVSAWALTCFFLDISIFMFEHPSSSK